MGGNALPVESSRLSLNDFIDVSSHVEKTFKQFFPHLRGVTIPAYRSKKDFGDLDFLYETEPGIDVTQVATALGAKYLVRNGTVLSFDYNLPSSEVFQVDLISAKPSEFEFALGYFSYNDLGNLIGLLAKPMGLKFGHQGLFYAMTQGTHRFATLDLNLSFKDSLEVVGLSWERYSKGFDNLEEIFEFVTSSRFFNTDIYLLENRNNKSRTRDRKRRTYMEFLDWCEKNKENLPAYSGLKTHDEWREQHLYKFIPAMRSLYDEAIELEHIRRKCKETLDGKLIIELTGFEDRTLSAFIAYLKNSMALMLDEISTDSKDYMLKVSQLTREDMSEIIKANKTLFKYKIIK